ncbi:zinc-dependent alcohol dehydrogenase family protein [Neoroseomonas oryzicola]|uniref:Alcohol dehydrogenase catalytic domain-containing protein n=1 Tax=Neoroseomonas oryzicola TaxID=535904 RepID=A0A9X9WEX7_9PROT|nr:zinc-dependent alcohol dehydrogenase family protein [Neoroseomonas oryzicola]MBR0658887.1 alcohol dehydrogenase catalytic domain-containing protein [Neoroseomonas oryzicola]NKE15761.1 alcohol dehydrogenase catalytic domain-containing protein [Neoroseomonas oryzicola]
MRIKAAVLYQQGLPRPYAETRPMVVEEVELDPPGPGELLIEVAAAGLCHSDLSTIENQRPRPLPIVIGHEGAGIVREVGPGISDLKPGDHVITVFAPSCGNCRYCVRGRPNICPTGNAARAAGQLPTGTKRLKRLDGTPINHNSGLSLYAQFAVVARRSCVKIEKDIPLDDAAIFGCAVMTGAGAVLNTAGIKAGEEVAIIGLGGVGMNALFGAVAAGAERIIAIDTNPKKLEMAKQWGATDVFLAGNDDCAAAVRDATDGGVDKVVETAGSIPAMQLALAITARGGETISAGLPNIRAEVSYLHASLVSEERSIRGSYMGSCVPERDLPRLLGLYRRGKLPVDKLKTSHITFDQINEGFDLLSDGAVLRQMLRPNA